MVNALINAQVAISSTILEEVSSISEKDCIELNILVFEPTLEQAMKAIECPGPLSFQDWICLYFAQENGWILVTNDMPLRKKCFDLNIESIWGIELLCILVESGGLNVNDCKSIILNIQSTNPKYITETIVKNSFIRLKNFKNV